MVKQDNNRHTERLSILEEISRLTARLQALEVAEAEEDAAAAAAAAEASDEDDEEVDMCETYGGVRCALRPGIRVQIMSAHNKSWYLRKGVLSRR